MRRYGISIVAAVSAVALLTALGLYVSGVLHAKYMVDPAWAHLSSAIGDLPVPGLSREQTAALVSDLDGDGRNDLVIGMRRQAPALVWYRRGVVGWTRHVIETDMLPIEAGGAAGDIDGDGDLDLVMGEDYQGGNVYWWENPLPTDEATRPWQRRLVKSSSANQHHDAAFGDFDDDGRGELAFWNQQSRTLFLADPPADVKGAGLWPLVSVFESDTTKIEGLAVADVDGDGQSDLIGGGRWFKHHGGERYVAEVIDNSMQYGRVAAGQLVPGGRPEMVLAAGDLDGPLRWYEWDGSSWVPHDLLENGVRHGHSLAVADVDRDGHLDIFVAEMHTPGAGDSARALVFYGDSRGTFRKRQLARGLGNHESRIADLDGDGDLDVLAKPYHWQAPRIDVLLNRRTPLDRWRRHVVDVDQPWRSIFVAAADIDGDGDQDIVSGGWWYENAGTDGEPWIRHTIGAPFRNMAVVADFDDDGDPDVLGTQGRGAERNAALVWARNDGGGRFTILENIDPGQGDFLQGAAIGSFHGGRRHVALSWHAGEAGIELLNVPPDPSRERWTLTTATPITQNEALSVDDVDGDGDGDLILGTIWLENDEPNWTASTIDPGSGGPDRNRVADINGDGQADVVVGFEAISELGEVVWYERLPAVHSQWRKHLVARVIGPMSLDVGDLDDDGDIDLVVGEHNLAEPHHARLIVFENRDGRGDNWVGHIVWKGDEHHDGALLTDIEGDGDQDIVSIGWSHGQVLLYENLREQR